MEARYGFLIFNGPLDGEYRCATPLGDGIAYFETMCLCSDNLYRELAKEKQ